MREAMKETLSAKFLGIILKIKLAIAIGRKWEIWFGPGSVGIKAIKFELTLGISHEMRGKKNVAKRAAKAIQSSGAP